MNARRRIAPGCLHDRVAPNLRVLFVGINPGLRSAALDHHFAGPSNRFWKLLFESGLVPERLTFEDDDRLPEWGYGVTNLVARPTAGIGDLDPRELLAARDALVRKIRRLRPRIVALVGTTVYRTLFGVKGPVTPGLAPERLGESLIFVLPNPSGRNAHHSYAEMVKAYRVLARMVMSR